MPTLVHSVSRNDNASNKRRIRQPGKAPRSHIRPPLLAERHGDELLTPTIRSALNGIIHFLETLFGFTDILRPFKKQGQITGL